MSALKAPPTKDRIKPPRWLKTHRTAIAFFLVITLFWGLWYSTTIGQVDTQRAGCLRQIADRASTMESWYAAYLARHATAVQMHEKPTGIDARSAATYLATVKVLQAHVDRKHSLVWPDPRVPNGQGPFLRPLGFGTFSCDGAYPYPNPVSFLTGI